MNKLLIPPSPNWYEVTIGACAPDNTFVYGARSDIVVIKPTPHGEPDDIHIIGRAHSQRVTSITLNKNWGQPHKLAASVAEDKIVKLWNIETLEKKLSHDKHLIHDRVVGVAFAADERVISCSENGSVAIWNVVQNQTRVLTNLFDSKITVTCLSTCPHASWLTAFGLKSGLVIVSDLRGGGKVLYKLRGHDKPVLSLAWCPVPFNIFPMKPRKQVLSNDVKQTLEVSDSVESNVKPEETSADSLNTSNAAGDGETGKSDIKTLEKEDFEDVSTKVGETNSSVNKEAELSLNYEEPRKEFLLASSAREGNIYIWRAGTDGRLQTFFNVLSNKSHSKKQHFDKIWIALCWVSPNVLLSTTKSDEVRQWNLPKPQDVSKQSRLIHRDHRGQIFNITAPTKGDESDQGNVWSLGQDRLVLNTDLRKERTNLNCYPTLGGGVICFAQSPLDPNRLAFGTNDGYVKVWDLSGEHTKSIVFSSYYQKIQSKVTALAWHPAQERLLAYGTAEGRIGIIDTASDSKPPKLFPDFFKTEIYKLEWGPSQGTLGLYVVAHGKLVIFDSRAFNKDPVLVDVPDNTFVYTVAWKPDHQILLLSSKSGSVVKYDVNLQITRTFYLHQKLQSIVWHPSSDSPYRNVFASVLKLSECVVYDLGLENDDGDDMIIAKFENRGVTINCIAWNPHCEEQLVMAGHDGICQICDVKRKTVLATYMDPKFDSVMTVVWSPLDSDYVIIGSAAQKLIIFKVSEHPHVPDSEITTLRNKKLKALTKEASDLLPKDNLKEKEAEHKPSKNYKSPLFPIFYSARENNQVSDLRKLLSWKSSDSTDDLKCQDMLSLFGKQDDMLKLVDANVSTLKCRGKNQTSDMLSLWKGDINSTIKNAIEEKRVTPWIISLSPMVSPKLWQTACETYAEQLLEEPEADALEIVTYLLASHQLERSIDVLCNKGMQREAYVLAKTRLPDDDPLVKSTLEKWAKSLANNGCFEMAAQCYIVLDKFEDAASILFRRSSVDVLEVAIDIARKSGNEELLKAVLFRYNAFKSPATLSEGSQANEQEHLEQELSLDMENTINGDSPAQNGSNICEVSHVVSNLDQDESISSQIKSLSDNQDDNKSTVDDFQPAEE